MTEVEIIEEVTDEVDSPLEFFRQIDADAIEDDEYTFRVPEELEPAVEFNNGEIPREAVDLVEFTVGFEEVEDREKAALDALADAAGETGQDVYIVQLYYDDTDGTRYCSDSESVGYELVNEDRRAFAVMPFVDVVEEPL